MGVLSSLSHLLHGSVKFCFQPGEEGGAGAQKMISEGVLNGVDQVFGLHVWSYDAFGSARVVNGPLMAGCAMFEITILGKGGHAAIPSTAHDAVLAVSHLTAQLHSIVSRDVSPLRECVVSVGTVRAGEATNVIAGEAKLEGTLRWFHDDDFEAVMQRMREICAGIEKGFRVEVALRLTTPKFPPTTNRSRECCELVRSAVRQVLPEGLVGDAEWKTTISEDFGFFLEERPGCFMLLGCGVDGDEVFAHHKPDFKLDERCLAVGAQIWVTMILERLMQWKEDN